MLTRSGRKDLDILWHPGLSKEGMGVKCINLCEKPFLEFLQSFTIFANTLIRKNREIYKCLQTSDRRLIDSELLKFLNFCLLVCNA